ncbi:MULTISPECIES: hypothetical protein [Amycolatopsis]|uniref:Uncharacterized protein n=1 Tax=Amycolatopsis albidoflavus TaxID=102226 RepID=A0ABW5HTP1_9PSEU
MTLLSRLPGKGRLRSRRDAGGMQATVSGAATVVHGADGAGVDASSMAAALPPDPDCLLVVVDVPPDSSAEVWESVAAAVPKGKGPVRLVPGRFPRRMSPQTAQWLAEWLGRPVVAPCGTTFQTAAGTLFVLPGQNCGWGRFRRGRPPVREGMRFPRPVWESSANSATWSLTGTASAEPLPGGLWLRSDGGEPLLDRGRYRLARWVPCQPEVLTIVLGGERLPPLPLEAVAELWSTLDDAARARAKFAQAGPVELPPSVSLGQALADLLGTAVVCYTGIPSGNPEDPHVVVLRADGSHGWHACAEQVVFRPGITSAAPVMLSAYRPPIVGLPELSPAVYRYTVEAVVEVVRAGLWVRPEGESPNTALVHSALADPARHLVLFEDVDAAQGTRMRALAVELTERLSAPTRRVTEVAPVSVLRSDAPPAPRTRPLENAGPVTALPWLSQLMETMKLEMPAAGEAATAEAPAAGPPEPPRPEPPAAEDLESAREWLKANWPADFGAHTAAVEAVLAKNPKVFRIRSGAERLGAVADAVALRMYLAGQGIEIDPGLRTGQSGADRTFSRCVAAGLAALPAYRGAAVSALTPTAAQWAVLDASALVTELGFLNLLAEPCSAAAGDTDLLVWSVSGRRTALLEPATGAVDRVMFAPKTAFKVLELARPGGASRGRIVLRELPAAEITAEGQPAPNRSSLDEMAKKSIRRSEERWAAAVPALRVPAAAAARFRVLPGVGDG